MDNEESTRVITKGMCAEGKEEAEVGEKVQEGGRSNGKIEVEKVPAEATEAEEYRCRSGLGQVSVCRLLEPAGCK